MLLSELMLLRPSAFRHACGSSVSPVWATGFLLVTGLVFGFLIAFFQRALGLPIQGVPVESIPDRILLLGNLVSGILVVLVFHGGVTLVVWLMAKAVGGPGNLGELYRATSYLFPLSFPALPRLALDSAAAGVDVSSVPMVGTYNVLAVIGVSWVFAGLYQLVRVTQHASVQRSVIAVLFFALFCYSILLIS